MNKDQLFRCLKGCVQSAINNHGPEVQADLIARRIVGPVHGFVLAERLAEREHCARIAGKRKNADLRILLGDVPDS